MVRVSAPRPEEDRHSRHGTPAAGWACSKTNKEMAELGRARNTEELGTSPTRSLMAVLFGWLIIVPPFVSIYKTCARLNAGERLTGRQGMEGGLLFLLWLFISPVGHYIFQSNLNKVLQAQAGASPAQPQVGTVQ